jgi:hypothetical protein
LVVIANPSGQRFSFVHHQSADDDLAVGRLADMSGCAFYGIGEQNKSGGSFNGID